MIYCGEQFANDAGPYASLLKSMKRVMAAEYSRDLSEKVFAAQARFIEMGFKQGGHAGYGLRRLPLKACGLPRAILEYGESKVSATDRVVLVWGPEHEVTTVRRVYALYLEQGARDCRLPADGHAQHGRGEALLREDHVSERRPEKGRDGQERCQ